MANRLCWIVLIALVACGDDDGRPADEGEMRGAADCVDDGDCAGDGTCLEGACVSATAAAGMDAVNAGEGMDAVNGGGEAGSSVEPGAGANEPDAGETDAPLRASDVEQVTVEVDWSTPTEVPPLPSAIEGADDRILGTWHEVDCDPAAPPEQAPWGCVRLTLERDASGGIGGFVEIERAAEAGMPPQNFVAPEGGFAPATDPAAGYPPDFDVNLYQGLSASFALGVRYRTLDGRFADDRLSFKWSTLDLWRQWCAIQTSYTWWVDEHAFSFCVPQDRETWTDIDEAKLVLCTSADLEPYCAAGEGLVPCPCAIGFDPRCSSAYCRCSATGCEADIHRGQYQVDLTLDGERLRGGWGRVRESWSAFTQDAWTGVLQKVEP